MKIVPMITRVSPLLQDRLWALPLFKTPVRTSASASYSPEPFRLVTAFLRQADLLEGRDSICTHIQVKISAGVGVGCRRRC